jgi:hypothetical protein
MTRPVLTKSENYRLCHAGAYGNRVRQWSSVEEWAASGYAGDVAVRVDLGAGGGPSEFGVPRSRVRGLAGRWCDLYGVEQDRIKLAEMADGLRVLQGEYLNEIVEVSGEVYHAVFRYTTETGPMPAALKKRSGVACGHVADRLLRDAMTPSSYEDWQELLTAYPGHVLEVSVWQDCLGDLPHRNAVVWEVRRY